MSPDLQKQLFTKYPTIFADVNKSPRESCMAFGIECGDGWYHILDALCEALTSGYTSWEKVIEDQVEGTEGVYFPYGTSTSFTVCATQVKEKMGGLRFYHSYTATPEFKALSEKYPKTAKLIEEEVARYYFGIIYMAEVMASHTCEITGKPGKLYSRGGWLKTLCEEEAAKEGYESIKEE